MATTRAYNVYVGAETGLLKGISTIDRAWQNLNAISETSRNKEITCLCWGNDSQSEICAGLRDNTVLTYDASGTTAKVTGPYGDESGHIKALVKFDGQFVTGFSNGNVSLWQEADTSEETLKIETGADNLWTLCQNSRERNIIATGGKENPLKLWDLNNSAAPVFTAKNVRNDWLNLRVPVWVTKAAFLGEGRRIVTGTGHHQLYVYDPGSPQRRPVLETKFLEHPITALAVRPDVDHQVFVGNTLGEMGLIDLRHGKTPQLYKGFSGGITDIQCHASMPLVVSSSIDRFVRVHHITDKTLSMKFYLKSRLNCILLTDDWPEEDLEQCGEGGKMKHQGQIQSEKAAGDAVDDNANVDRDDDAVWDSLDVVKTKTVAPKGQKRRLVTGSSRNQTEEKQQKKKKKRKA